MGAETSFSTWLKTVIGCLSLPIMGLAHDSSLYFLKRASSSGSIHAQPASERCLFDTGETARVPSLSQWCVMADKSAEWDNSFLAPGLKKEGPGPVLCTGKEKNLLREGREEESV